MQVKKTTKKSTAQEEFKDPVLIVRTSDENLKSHGGFQWPESGYVEAPDFSPTVECGHGLHGLLDGEGDWDLMNWDVEAKGMIVTTDRSQIIELSGKVKFRSALVQKVASLAACLCEVFAGSKRINKQVEEILKAGKEGETAASGDSSQLAASGDYSKLAASGDYSQLAASGYSSKLAASGYSSKLAASGYSSKLAASGEDSVVVAAGTGSIAKAATGGVIALPYKDGKRIRIAVGYVGENLKADTWYIVNGNGEFEEVEA